VDQILQYFSVKGAYILMTIHGLHFKSNDSTSDSIYDCVFYEEQLILWGSTRDCDLCDVLWRTVQKPNK